MPYFYHFVDKVYDAPKATLRKLSLERTRSLPAMPRQIKSGYLMHYKKRMFGRDWRELLVILYEDSSMVWLRDRDSKCIEGSLRLSDSPDLIAAGQYVCRVPKPPELPPGTCNNLAIAISSSPRDRAHWFLTHSQHDLIEWMKAINSTLPPPPPPPLEELRLLQGKLSLAHSSSTRSLYADGCDILKMKGAQQQQQQQHFSVCVGSSSRLAVGLSPVRTRMAAQQQQHSRGKENQQARQLLKTRSEIVFGSCVDSNGDLNQQQHLGSCANSCNEDDVINNQQQLLHQHAVEKQLSIEDSGEEMMLLAGLATGWGSGYGWLYSHSFCGTCALMDQSAVNPGHATPSQQLPGYDDEPDVDVGDTDVGADFGDFGF